MSQEETAIAAGGVPAEEHAKKAEQALVLVFEDEDGNETMLALEDGNPPEPEEVSGQAVAEGIAALALLRTIYNDDKKVDKKDASKYFESSYATSIHSVGMHAMNILSY